MLLCGCVEIVLLAITAYPTASVYSFQACRPPTGMLVDSQFCNKLRCRDSGFVQSEFAVPNLFSNGGNVQPKIEPGMSQFVLETHGRRALGVRHAHRSNGMP
jgi:hypothetical protein